MDDRKKEKRLEKYQTTFFDPNAEDTGEKESTTYVAFNPVGGGVTEFGSSTMGLDITAELGKVKVVIT